MSHMLYRSMLETPLGPLTLVSTSKGLAAIGIGRDATRQLERWIGRSFPGAAIMVAGERHTVFTRQICEYFDHRRRVFDLPLDLWGTDFQKAVWSMVTRIPFGQTASYGEIAHLIGRPRAGRAVGAANARNPIPLVVPCHRVVAADGSLAGYGGGLDMKRRLLVHEGVLRVEPVQMRLFRRSSSGSTTRSGSGILPASFGDVHSEEVVE